MLTVQACQQHQPAVMRPNKAKSFPAGTVPALAKLGRRRREKRGTPSEKRRNTRGANVSKQKCRRWRSRGMVGVPHTTSEEPRQNLGRKHLELSERRKATGDAGGEEVRPQKNTRPPGRDLDRGNSRSARTMFAQQRSTGLTVSGTSTPC